jgi:hypothetical protein
LNLCKTCLPLFSECRSALVEQQQLELSLSKVLACQGKLLLRRTALTAATKLLEYGGLVVNFGCLAYAVFSGAWEADRATPGGMAAKVSVASFYLLTLIYSFTQVRLQASLVLAVCADAVVGRFVYTGMVSAAHVVSRRFAEFSGAWDADRERPGGMAA